MALLNSKTAFWHISSLVASAIFQVASHHLKQQQNVWTVFVPCSVQWSDIHSYTQLYLLVFLNILKKIWTVYHWHVYIMLQQNMKHILPSAGTELVWQKGQVFGSHTHQFSVYSNPSICWGPIIITVLALFSVVILRK